MRAVDAPCFLRVLRIVDISSECNLLGLWGEVSVPTLCAMTSLQTYNETVGAQIEAKQRKTLDRFDGGSVSVALDQQNNVVRLKADGCADLPDMDGLDGLDAATFEDCGDLPVLPGRLKAVFVDSPSSFGDVSWKSLGKLRLTELWLTNCGLSEMPADMLKRQSETPVGLRYVTLDGNTGLGDWIVSKNNNEFLENVERLSLRNCGVSEFLDPPSRLKKMRYLDLSDNLLSSLPNKTPSPWRGNSNTLVVVAGTGLTETYLEGEKSKVEKGCNTFEVEEYDRNEHNLARSKTTRMVDYSGNTEMKKLDDEWFDRTGLSLNPTILF